MWKVVLSFIPWEKVIPWLVSKLSGYSDKFVEKLIDDTIKLVKRVEYKYGINRGEKKFKEVKKELMKDYGKVKGWVINLVIELAVAIAKNKGLIK